MKRPTTIEPANGKLAVLLPGLGAVATTFIAGVALARRGLAAPVGSLTQLGTIRLGKRTERRTPKIADFAPLAHLDQLEFGAWDIFEDDALASAEHSHVLRPEHIDLVKDELRAIKPMRGVFYPEYVKRLHGTHVKRGPSKADMVAQLRDDIRTFIRERGCDRAVAVWCGSTEVYTHANGVHSSVSAFEQALAKSDLAELLPRNAASVQALDELRARMPGLQYLGVVVDTGDPSGLPAGERFVDDLAARVRTYPPELARTVRTGTAEEHAFLEKHAALYVDAADLRAIRQRIEARRGAIGRWRARRAPRSMTKALRRPSILATSSRSTRRSSRNAAPGRVIATRAETST